MGDTGRSKGVLGAFVVCAASVVLCLLVLEICVRWFFHAEVDSATLRRELEGSSVRALVEPSADRALFFELKPNLRVFSQRWVITGADGYRVATSQTDTPTESAPDVGVVRIAVLGDSTSFGWGVAYEDSYPDQYGRRMAELSAAPIDLRNYSVPAYNAVQELRTFQTKVKAYRPSLIILHHDHNDADPTPKMMGAAYMPAEYGDNPLHSALLKWTLRRVRRLQNERARAVEEQGHRRRGGYLVSGPLYDAHLEARRELVAEASALGIPVIVVIFNAWVTRDARYETSEDYTTMHRDLSASLGRMGYYVLDLYPLYQSVLSERGWSNLTAWWLSPTDGHPNAEGHQFIAESLVDFTLSHARLSAVFGLKESQ